MRFLILGFIYNNHGFSALQCSKKSDVPSDQYVLMTYSHKIEYFLNG